MHLAPLIQEHKNRRFSAPFGYFLPLFVRFWGVFPAFVGVWSPVCVPSCGLLPLSTLPNPAPVVIVPRLFSLSAYCFRPFRPISGGFRSCGRLVGLCPFLPSVGLSAPVLLPWTRFLVYGLQNQKTRFLVLCIFRQTCPKNTANKKGFRFYAVISPRVAPLGALWCFPLLNSFRGLYGAIRPQKTASYNRRYSVRLVSRWRCLPFCGGLSCPVRSVFPPFCPISAPVLSLGGIVRLLSFRGCMGLFGRPLPLFCGFRQNRR